MVGETRGFESGPQARVNAQAVLTTIPGMCRARSWCSAAALVKESVLDVDFEAWAASSFVQISRDSLNELVQAFFWERGSALRGGFLEQD